MRLARRDVITGLAAALSTTREAQAQAPSPVPPRSGVLASPGADLEILDLWPGLAPGGGGPVAADGRFDETREGVITNVTRPCLLVMRAARPNGAAMLVAAGGGYRRIDIGNEGVPVANWLAASGVTAFVLIYRLPGEGWAAGPVAPIQDVQRALRFVRSEASRFAVDPQRIGVLGFSAGGHLMGEAAVRSADALYAAVDARDDVSPRPDLAGLIYPVITLRPPFDRTSTRRVLVGESPTLEEAAAHSVDSHVRERGPPIFLSQSADDPIAVVDNSLVMFSALRRALVPVELHLFERGGHGYGLGVPGSPAAAWPGLFLTWMRRRGFLRA
ncbi:alpha/beta hydrolase [Methylobacterium sp. Leaf108]|uniref:alpha/beta hydrolase n=1 Tax=Methylobacterium sp. Leaf108 TaxID=1736256 RepID=UPI0006FD7C63|nr:alpha/beta hydrolase [Methylobacterium sp. Leaf108]KQP51827.1 pectin acetylesterase [Methylobacterium sp. Leaf108]